MESEGMPGHGSWEAICTCPGEHQVEVNVSSHRSPNYSYLSDSTGFSLAVMIVL